MNYGDRSSVFEGMQVGAEASFGSAVTALHRIMGVYIDPTPVIPINMHRGRGSLVATAAVKQKEHTTGNITGIAGFRDLAWLLSGNICATTPITPDGATKTRRWIFKPYTYQPNSIQTFTFEHGSNNGTFAERFPFGLIDTLALRSTDAEAAISGSILGAKLQEAISISSTRSAMANPTVAPVLTATGVATTAAIPTVRQHAHAGATAAADPFSITVVLANDPTAGDALVLVIEGGDQSGGPSGMTPTPTGGGVTWVLQQHRPGTGPGISTVDNCDTWIYTGINASGAGGTRSVTISMAGNAAASAIATLVDMQSVPASSVFETVPAVAGAANSSTASITVNTSSTDDGVLIFGLQGGSGTVPTLSGLSGTTTIDTFEYSDVSGGNPSILTLYKQATGSSMSATFSGGGSFPVQAAAVAIKPGPGTPGTTSLEAGTYTGGYTWVDTTGETTDVTSTVVLLAGQSITFAAIAGTPAGASVKYYLSPAAGNTSIQTTGVIGTGAGTVLFTELPGSSAGAPPGTSTATGLTVATVPDTPVDPDQINVYVGTGPWIANTQLPTGGWNQLDRCFESEWSISNRYRVIMTQDDRLDTFSGFVELAPTVNMNTTIEHNAVSQALMGDMRAKAAKFLRWEAKGPLIETGFPFRLEVIMPVTLLNPRPTDTNDVYSRQYEWDARADDDIFGSWIQVILDTDIASL